jgi:hypothetical protein
MSRELLQQCLNKFEHLWEIGIDAEYKVDLIPDIKALRDELAKPEQEPFDWASFWHKQYERAAEHATFMGEQVKFVTEHIKELKIEKPWVGLTDKERNEMIGRIQHDQYTRQRDLIGKTQIITELYLKERNT